MPVLAVVHQGLSLLANVIPHVWLLAHTSLICRLRHRDHNISCYVNKNSQSSGNANVLLMRLNYIKSTLITGMRSMCCAGCHITSFHSFHLLSSHCRTHLCSLTHCTNPSCGSTASTEPALGSFINGGSTLCLHLILRLEWAMASWWSDVDTWSRRGVLPFAPTRVSFPLR